MQQSPTIDDILNPASVERQRAAAGLVRCNHAIATIDDHLARLADETARRLEKLDDARAYRDKETGRLLDVLAGWVDDDIDRRQVEQVVADRMSAILSAAPVPSLVDFFQCVGEFCQWLAATSYANAPRSAVRQRLGALRYAGVHGVSQEDDATRHSGAPFMRPLAVQS